MKLDKTLGNLHLVQTLGYYEANDGGGATYLIRAKKAEDVEDGGSIHFVSNELVAELIVEDHINAKQFGAFGNDDNDDTVALNNFFNYDTNIKKIINQGVYKTTDTIFIKGKWRKDGENDYDNSLKYITFNNATINYAGAEDKCILFMYNHFETTFEGLTITRTSNKGYIDMTGMWHCKFINFDMKCDLKMNYDTTIVNDTIFTTSIHTCVFDNINLLGNLSMDSTETFINSIHFENSCLNGKNIQDYAIELTGETGFQNIKFTDCDISYYTKAILKINNESENARNIKFESCYFDTGLPLTEDYNFKGFKIDLINNFDASNVCKHLLYTYDYMKNFNIYNQNSNCNSLPIGFENLNYNGDFSYIGENSKHSFLSNSENVTKTFITTNSNNSGNALRLTFKNAESTTLYSYGVKAPIKTNYTVAYRMIKRSGTGTLLIGNMTQYKPLNLADVEKDKEFILVNSPLYLADREIGADLGSSLTLSNGEDVVLDIIEIIIVAGNVLSINLPLNEKAKINPTANGTLIRPTKIEKGYCYFDTTLNKPIWYNGTNWVDATGTKV
jgi:hypothetical protein